MVRVQGYDEDDVEVLENVLVDLMMRALQQTVDRTAAHLTPSLTAGVTFHQAGKHDQRTHGHGGKVAHFDEHVAGAKTGDEAHGAAPAGYTRGKPGTTHGLAGEEDLGPTIGFYGFGGHKPMNEGLRAHGGDVSALDPSMQAHVSHLDSAMSQSALTHDVVVHRGVRTGEGTFGDTWSSEPGSMTGVKFRDHGFVSTTTKESVAESFGGPVQMRIMAPAGTPAVSIRGSIPGLIGDEFELLLGRGLEFEIINDTLVDGVRHLDMEVVS